jgi:hypothetical protein
LLSAKAVRIAVTSDVHVEGCRAAAQHVIVDGRDLDAVLDQLGHDGIDLGLEQHEITHHHCPAMHRLECRPAAERQCRPDGDAVERHLQVGSRKSITMNISGNRRSSSDCFVDLLPVDFLAALLGAGSGADGRHCANRKHVNRTHDDVLL